MYRTLFCPVLRGSCCPSILLAVVPQTWMRRSHSVISPPRLNAVLAPNTNPDYNLLPNNPGLALKVIFRFHCFRCEGRRIRSFSPIFPTGPFPPPPFLLRADHVFNQYSSPSICLPYFFFLEWLPPRYTFQIFPPAHASSPPSPLPFTDATKSHLFPVEQPPRPLGSWTSPPRRASPAAESPVFLFSLLFTS